MSQKMPAGSGWLIVLCGVLFAAAQAGAEDDPPAYKCVNRTGTTYSQVRCPGGKPLNVRPVQHTDRSAQVPQGRAIAAKRARLPPQDRQECQSLDVLLVEQQAQLKAKGSAVALDDEMPLVQSRKKFRELRC
ncbi:MAG: hypothetical protein JWP22_3726 [Ramlibacter sp.]|jgi:hypothetical protein|nr:hypothetical protein [Ramlibacter sp.]MDB5915051.1 hypothetical protein [Ramlibacter sp.]